MNFHLETPTLPATLPVSLDDAKEAAHISWTHEDTTLTNRLKSVITQIQDELGRQLITASYVLHLTRKPCEEFIKLPRPPLVSVTGVEYYDTDNTLQTFSSGNYSVMTGGVFGEIHLEPDIAWPDVSDEKEYPIKITYSAGYGTDATSIPPEIIEAIYIKFAQANRFRGDDEKAPPMDGRFERAMDLMRVPRVVIQ